MSLSKVQRAKARIQELNTQEKHILCALANVREQMREEINRLNLNKEEKKAWKKMKNTRC